MTEQEQTALDDLRENYDSIHDNLDDLLEACGNDESLKHQLGDAMGEALQTYIRAQTHILQQSEEVITGINKAADDAQKAITAAIENFKNIKDTLNTITKAVKIVGTLVMALS